MALMRAQNRQGAQHRDGLRVGLKVSGSVENGGLVEYFFGKDGKARLQHDKFVQFMRDLHEEVWRTLGKSLTDTFHQLLVLAVLMCSIFLDPSIGNIVVITTIIITMSLFIPALFFM